MKRLIPFIYLLCVHWMSCAQDIPRIVPLPESELMKFPIKEIVANYYNGSLYIGTANHGKLIDELSGRIAAREFDYMTPANDFKQSYIHPVYDLWRWELPDHWITYAADNKIRLRLHSPISPQCSKWVKEDNRTPVELTRMLEEYMTQLCIRYANQPNVQWMDVVNETIAKENVKDPVFGDRKRGDWFGAREGTTLWENPWTIIGFDEESEIHTPLYINKAFEIATRYTPSRVKLIINQHGNFESVVWERMKKLVVYLREKGYRVDGLGWQAHIDTGWEKIPGNVERLDKFVSWCHRHSLEFHITEMNVWIKDGDKTCETEQAETYGKVVSTLLKHVNEGVVGISFWNVRDEDTPNEKWMGCLWDNAGRARPGYEYIKKELINHITQ